MGNSGLKVKTIWKLFAFFQIIDQGKFREKPGLTLYKLTPFWTEVFSCRELWPVTAHINVSKQKPVADIVCVKNLLLLLIV